MGISLLTGATMETSYANLERDHLTLSDRCIVSNALLQQRCEFTKSDPAANSLPFAAIVSTTQARAFVTGNANEADYEAAKQKLVNKEEQRAIDKDMPKVMAGWGDWTGSYLHRIQQYSAHVQFVKTCAAWLRH
jgi:hypothetical protein